MTVSAAIRSASWLTPKSLLLARPDRDCARNEKRVTELLSSATSFRSGVLGAGVTATNYAAAQLNLSPRRLSIKTCVDAATLEYMAIHAYTSTRLSALTQHEIQLGASQQENLTTVVVSGFLRGPKKLQIQFETASKSLLNLRLQPRSNTL